MIMKSLLGSNRHLCPGDTKRQKEPEKMLTCQGYHQKIKNKQNTVLPDDIVDDLNPAEDGEASQKSHCAPNQTQLGLKGHLEKGMFEMAFR